ncbi:MAG: hypothetical protein O3A00_16870 [Planctomycetota bacterium]|nr:hypothetical protein [Planctomycetota bacterium]
MRLWTILGIGLLASGFSQANVNAEEEVVKLLRGLSSKLDALDGQIAGMNERIEGLEREDAAGGRGMFSFFEADRGKLTAPHTHHHYDRSPRFDHEFNAVLQHEFEELKQRERAKRVACVLKSLLDRYGHCCEKCLQSGHSHPTPVKPTSLSYGSTFLTPACYTTKTGFSY